MHDKCMLTHEKTADATGKIPSNNDEDVPDSRTYDSTNETIIAIYAGFYGITIFLNVLIGSFNAYDSLH